ncbi:hypothetical protein SAMN04487988_104135 [Algoriphagus hitonicola]|uniref:MetA-pathway of phenol degradation n=3 Tax=Algoriphagus hitonicola TaxID=435880 RepID=A0A1I2SD91_9BACT|nr:hypothetical protein SAMN04487988_104135 [Algoriphagus hitonicola]
MLFAQAPEPPIPIEIMPSSDQLYFQMVVKKQFAPTSQFNFFTVTTFTANYQNDMRKSSVLIPAQIQYEFGKKGFGVMAGGEMNSVIGFYPVFGPLHTYASKEFLAVTVATFYVNQEQDFKLFGLYEYKPVLSEKWTLYTRLQFIYNQSIREGDHNRSYLYLRAGLKKGPMIFGIGANLDQFGPDKQYRDSFGLFVRWELR